MSSLAPAGPPPTNPGVNVRPATGREGPWAWAAARLRVPAERVAAAAAGRSFPGSVDSPDPIERVFALERELAAGHGECARVLARLKLSKTSERLSGMKPVV